MAIDTAREFDRQRDTMLSRGLPALAGMSARRFSDSVERLRPAVLAVLDGSVADPTPSRVPFVLVVTERLIAAKDLVPMLTLAGRVEPGVVDRNHGEGGLEPYRAIPDLDLPAAPAYAVVGVERGEEFCGRRPEDALPTILGRGRTPLTIHEGIALLLHFPEVLEKNRCFMLSGSRRGDRRVPALWISSRAPKLGWCWDGNPHTWLGIASAGSRRGPIEP